MRIQFYHIRGKRKENSWWRSQGNPRWSIFSSLCYSTTDGFWKSTITQPAPTLKTLAWHGRKLSLFKPVCVATAALLQGHSSSVHVLPSQSGLHTQVLLLIFCSLFVLPRMPLPNPGKHDPSMEVQASSRGVWLGFASQHKTNHWHRLKGSTKLKVTEEHF